MDNTEKDQTSSGAAQGTAIETTVPDPLNDNSHVSTPIPDPAPQTTAGGISKRAQKRQKKQLEMQERKKQKKAKMKVAKQETREKRREETEKWFNSLSPEEQEQQREKRQDIVKSRLLEKQQLVQRLEKALMDGQRVVFDSSFSHLMLDKEAVSLDRQLQYSYNFNKALTEPMQMHFTSVVGRTAEIMSKIVGLTNWKVHIHKEDVTEVFDRSQLVYLTADSPNVVHGLSKDDVYVIGAFVDRNRHKGATFKKAQELGIRTARLPLADHVAMDATKVLTVNHVFAILGHVQNGVAWREAIMQVLPGRKGARDIGDGDTDDDDDGLGGAEFSDDDHSGKDDEDNDDKDDGNTGDRPIENADS